MTFGWEEQKPQELLKTDLDIFQPCKVIPPSLKYVQGVRSQNEFIYWICFENCLLLIQIFSDCTDIQKMYQELSTNMWKTAYKAGVKLVKSLYKTNCAEGNINDYQRYTF